MKPRKIIKKIHLWLTLIFFVPLVIQGLTGTILVFEHEIEDLISGGHKEYKLSENTTEQNLQEVGKIIAAASKVAPENTLRLSSDLKKMSLQQLVLCLERNLEFQLLLIHIHWKF